MRDMKCRVWDGTEMRYLPTMIVDDFSVGFAEEDEFYVDINTHHPTPGLIVTWFTGLKDKNGVEIFEGDIVSFSEEFDEDRFYAVEWQVNGYWLGGWDGNEYGFPDETSLEVIGNIYENPDLLKQSNQSE